MAGNNAYGKQPDFYGQTLFVLLSDTPTAGFDGTATGRAGSDEATPLPSKIRAATLSASISACNPEICAWNMAIWFSFSLIAS
jgi:hypothetical protein